MLGSAVDSDRNARMAAYARATAGAPRTGSLHDPSAKKKVAPAKKPARPVAPAAHPYTGPYSDALNEIDTQQRQNQDIASRRLKDNVAYQKWVAAQQAKLAGVQEQHNVEATRQMAATQALTKSAQAETQATLDAQRGAREGGVTSGPGSSRAALAGEDTMIQSLLGAQGQRSIQTAAAERGQQGLLQAATAAAALAAGARIRGEASQENTRLRSAKSDLLVHKEDTLSQQRAAESKAAADMARFAAQQATDQARINAQLAIASDSNNTRSQIAAANREAAAIQGRANRRAKLATSGSHGVPAATQDSRNKAARALRDQVTAATSALADFKRNPPKDAKGHSSPLDRTTLTNKLTNWFPDISEVAINAAISAVFDKRAKNRMPVGRSARALKRELDAIRHGR
jgi:hypothetical protein